MTTSTSAASAREGARHGDGKFGVQPADEADDVDLFAGLDEEDPDRNDWLSPSQTEFTFPAWKATIAANSIDKANRRAERAGITERFSYEVETWEEQRKDPDTGLTVIEERARLTLDRPTVSHDGWEFAATLTWDEEAGMISRSAPGAELLERPTERLCDVCGKQRKRNDTYVIQRDGVQMQVGSDCLAQFMGIKPAGLWMLDFDPEESADLDEPPATMRVETRHDSTEMIGLGLAAVEAHGWTPRSASGPGRTATADVVTEALYGISRRREDIAAREALIARGKELTAEAEEVLAYAREAEGTSDYAQNLRQIAAAPSVTGRNLALLLSAISSSRRAKEKAAEAKAEAASRQQAAAESEWVGAVKDKVADVPVTVTSTFLTENFYGGRTVHTTIIGMRDNDGNVWKWFASGNHEDEIKVGDSKVMKGTVKKHDEYKGVKETVVTRAKLDEPVVEEDDADAGDATPETAQPAQAD